jgi:hypothetical protein
LPVNRNHLKERSVSLLNYARARQIESAGAKQNFIYCETIVHPAA